MTFLSCLHNIFVYHLSLFKKIMFSLFFLFYYSFFFSFLLFFFFSFFFLFYSFFSGDACVPFFCTKCHPPVTHVSLFFARNVTPSDACVTPFYTKCHPPSDACVPFFYTKCHHSLCLKKSNF